MLDGVLPDDADGSNVLLGVTEEDALGDAVMECVMVPLGDWLGVTLADAVVVTKAVSGK